MVGGPVLRHEPCGRRGVWSGSKGLTFRTSGCADDCRVGPPQAATELEARTADRAERRATIDLLEHPLLARAHEHQASSRANEMPRLNARSCSRLRSRWTSAAVLTVRCGSSTPASIRAGTSASTGSRGRPSRCTPRRDDLDRDRCRHHQDRARIVTTRRRGKSGSEQSGPCVDSFSRSTGTCA